MITAFLLAVLAIAYIVLKVINTRAKFEEQDARREAEEAAAKTAEEDMMMAEAVDVEPEVIEAEEEE